jgi:hypothetical protein
LSLFCNHLLLFSLNCVASLTNLVTAAKWARENYA